MSARALLARPFLLRYLAEDFSALIIRRKAKQWIERRGRLWRLH